MLAKVSVLLGAAAGVHAIFGGEIAGVQISKDSFICADECVHDDAFFSPWGYGCALEDVIVNADPKGRKDQDQFGCKDAPPLAGGGTVRPLASGEKPGKCDVRNVSEGLNSCLADKIPGSKATRMVQWSDIAKELRTSTSDASQAGEDLDNKPPPSEPALPGEEEGDTSTPGGPGGPESPEGPGSPGDPGRPGQPGRPGRPGQPGKPGDDCGDGGSGGDGPTRPPVANPPQGPPTEGLPDTPELPPTADQPSPPNFGPTQPGDVNPTQPGDGGFPEDFEDFDNQGDGFRRWRGRFRRV